MPPLMNPESTGVGGRLGATGESGTTHQYLDALHNGTFPPLQHEDDYDYDFNESLSTYYWDELLPPLTVYVMTLMLGVLGNSLIIYTIVRYSGMKSTTNVFLASLASADLLLILICVPIKTAKVFAYSWTFGWFLCKGIHYLQNVSAICSVLNLTAMSMERYYAILFPFRAKYILTVHQAQKMTALVWVLSILLSTPILFIQIHSRVGVRVESYWCHRDWERTSLWQAYETYMLVVVLLVPTLIMGFAYSAIGYKLTKVMIERSSLVGSGHRVSSRSRDDDRDVRQIVTMLFVVVVLFILCWSPLLVTNVLRAWGVLPAYDPSSFFKHFYNTVHLLAYFNSCINPIVYGFLSKNFRESFYAALCPCLRPTRPPARQMSLSHTRTTSVGYKESFRLSVRYTNRATNV
ncbi:gastrin/cholecystokinin type B receptor-like [Homarus americanus]|uniref:gastrin/cholecystokinin type B receptor-like n=1 Tax=Homarus americanus TaxID=6706 RepID=UPI001C43E261|nr:gastrin/cholecystokinin type B receptor-like [Homarus americanus]